MLTILNLSIKSFISNSYYIFIIILLIFVFYDIKEKYIKKRK